MRRENEMTVARAIGAYVIANSEHHSLGAAHRDTDRGRFLAYVGAHPSE
jgi:hypothetical protein